MEWIYAPWPWYVAGPLITLVMFALLYFGTSFGVSSNLRAACASVGAGRLVDFFKYDWKKEIWNLVFVAGAVIGGFVASEYLMADPGIALGTEVKAEMQALGIAAPGESYLPPEIFGLEALFSLKGVLILVAGGFFVGFGARYAGGCTSGHAISGLSNLQLPSLIAVIGFFIGGLLMTYFILPLLLSPS